MTVLCPQDKFEKLLRASDAFAKDPEGMEGIWKIVEEHMYSLEPRERQLGLGDQVSTRIKFSNIMCAFSSLSC